MCIRDRLYLTQHGAISPNYKFTPDHLYIGRAYHSGKQVSIKFEGDSNNDYETELTVDNPTADRTITIPDETGTVLLQNSTSGLFDIRATTAGRNYIRNSGTFNYLYLQNSTSGTGTDDGSGFGSTQGGNTIITSSCLLYTSPSPRDKRQSRMPSSA